MTLSIVTASTISAGSAPTLQAAQHSSAWAASGEDTALDCRSSTDHIYRKSQLAIEYAHLVRSESPATWAFWVHAGTQERFKQGYRRIAEATKLDGWDDPKADVLRLVCSWLCDESNGRWLIVVDSADDASVFFQDVSPSATASSSDPPPAELLSDFLPQSSNGSILVTSRSRDVAFKLTGAHSSIVEIKPMDKDAALALLQKKLGRVDSEDEAVQLIQSLDAMPLALTQAAAFIKKRAPRMSVSRYIDEVRRSESDRAQLLNEDVGDIRRDGRASNSIIATWHISFKYIQTRTPNAARLLSLMSLFDRQEIPRSLLHDWYEGHDDEGADLDGDMNVLTDFSLVEVSADRSEFEMHRLVQFSTKKWLELNTELEEWKKAYVLLMDEKYPVGRHENWPVCQKLFPHAEVVLNSQPEDEEAQKAWASILCKAAWYAKEMRQYVKAYKMGSGALRARETVLGPEHADTLNSLNSLGLVVNLLGRYDEAEAMHKKALEAKRRVLGADHPSTLTSMVNLASAYRNQGRREEAEKLEIQAMKTRKRVLGNEHPDTLASFNHLGLVFSSQTKYEEAEAMRQRPPQLQEKMSGEEHSHTGDLPLHRYTTAIYEHASLSGQELVFKKELISNDRWRCKGYYSGIQEVGEARSWKIAKHITSQKLCKSLGISSISCKSCSKQFATQSAVNEHMAATGHGTPSISCKTCPKKFYTQSAAKEHMEAVRH